jgi:tetratricopeptide (TPR) repeat protein
MRQRSRDIRREEQFLARLSVCLIARDEEALLPGCLASLAGVADEVVLVDTGSADATARLAREAGARVFEWAWRDDFAAARNEALSHAKGHWVLLLDADERLSAGAEKGLRAAMGDPRAVAGLLRLHDAARADAPAAEVIAGRARKGEAEWLLRLFKRLPDLRWEGVVHEHASTWLARHGSAVVKVDADIIHLGAVAETRTAKGKGERNLALLRRRVETAPADLYALGSLGNEAYLLGRLDEAEATASRGLAALSGAPPGARALRVAATAALVALARGDPERALAAVDAGEAHDGAHPDYHFLRAWALEGRALTLPAGPARTALLEQAVASARAALALRGAALPDSCVVGATRHLAAARLGTALVLLGRPAEAQSAFADALALQPGHLESRLGELEARLDCGEAAAVLTVLEPMLSAGPADAWILAASAARALGSSADAALFAQRAATLARKGVVSRHRLERLRGLQVTPASCTVAPDF